MCMVMGSTSSGERLLLYLHSQEFARSEKLMLSARTNEALMSTPEWHVAPIEETIKSGAKHHLDTRLQSDTLKRCREDLKYCSRKNIVF